MKEKLNKIYRKLFGFYGKQYWWPGEGLEIVVGAVLVQQTNWKNVEKALEKLRLVNCLSIDCLKNISVKELEQLIRSTGYYNIKAKRLQNLMKLLAIKPHPSRNELLEVNGVGPETADSILLYRFNEPVFVVDAYTFRIFRRLGIYEGESYANLQRLFMDNLQNKSQMFNEYHALIVRHAKNICLKTKPKCIECPLKDDCKY